MTAWHSCCALEGGGGPGGEAEVGEEREAARGNCREGVVWALPCAGQCTIAASVATALLQNASLAEGSARHRPCHQVLCLLLHSRKTSVNNRSGRVAIVSNRKWWLTGGGAGGAIPTQKVQQILRNGSMRHLLKHALCCP